MINVSWAAVFYIPMLLNLLVVVILGIFYFIRQREPHMRYVNERIYRCSMCGHVYVDARDVPLSRCPRCECLNDAVRT